MHTINSQARLQQTHQRQGGPQPPNPSPTTSSSPEPSPPPLRYGQAVSSPQQGIPAATVRNTKLDQIIQNFYTKVAQVIIQARLTHHDGQPLILPQATTSTGSTASTRSVASNLGASKGAGAGGKKTNKWFNLDMDDLDIFKDELRFWRTTATTLIPSSLTNPGTTPPPMIIELYLDTSELTQSQILVIMNEKMQSRVDLTGSGSGASFVGGRYGGGNSGNVGYAQKSILLESWVLNLNQPTPDPPPDLPVVYKKSIIFFRSLYAYVRLLPAFRLQRRLRKMKGAGLRLGYRLVATPTVRDDEIPIDVSIVENDSRPATSEYRFGSIDTPHGVLTLLVVYRLNCDFNVDDSERDLSSRFIDMDENYFKPTMVRYRKDQDLRKRTSLDGGRSGLEVIGGAKMVREPSRGSKQSFTESHASQTLSIGSGNSGTPPSGQGLGVIYNQGGRPEGTESTPISTTRNEEDSHGLRSQRAQRRMSLRSHGSLGSLSNSPPKTSSTPVHRVSSGRNITDAASIGLEDTGTPPTGGSSPSSTLGPAAASSILGRRPSIGIISPFKSPSFPSSPTQYEPIPTPSTSGQRSSPSTLLQKSTSYSSLAHRSPHERTPPNASPILARAPAPSTSTGRSTPQQPQFSSTFDRYRYGNDRGSPTRDNLVPLARKASKASVASHGSDSPWFKSQTEDDEVNNFVKMVDSHQNLNVFSKRSGSANHMSGSAMSGGMDDSMSHFGGSGISSKSALSHFQALREIHNDLSESMTSNALFLPEESGVTSASPTDLQTTPIATSTSPGSSSTLSQGRAHQPAIPSPLHTEAVPLPVRIPQESSLSHHGHGEETSSQQHRQNRALLMSAHQRNGMDSRSGSNDNGFLEPYSSFPQDAHRQEHENASRRGVPDGLFDTSLARPAHHHPLSPPIPEATGTYSASTSMAAISSRVMRRYPSSGGNSISSISSARGSSQMARHGSGGSMNENSSSGLSSAAVNITGARIGSLDDDDSLLFAMSELSAEASSNSPSAGPFGTASILNGPFAMPETETGMGTKATSSVGATQMGGTAQIGEPFGDYKRSTAVSSDVPFAIGIGGNTSSTALSRGTGEDMVRRVSVQEAVMGTLLEEEERSTESGRSSGVASRSDSASSSDSLRMIGAASGRAS